MCRRTNRVSPLRNVTQHLEHPYRTRNRPRGRLRRTAAPCPRAYHGVMADVRDCEQCGTVFEPRREHERFCSARCRIAWNRANTSGQHSGDTALGWSVTAMAGTAQRLREAGTLDLPQALAVISEAVWWVTIVDATMIRYHPGEPPRMPWRPWTPQHGGRPRERSPGCGSCGTGWATTPTPPTSSSRSQQPAAPRGCPGRRVDLEAGTRAGARAGPAARQDMGDQPVPAVPGAAGRPARRADHRTGHRVPHPRLRSLPLGRGCQHARRTVSTRRSASPGKQPDNSDFGTDRYLLPAPAGPAGGMAVSRQPVLATCPVAAGE